MAKRTTDAIETLAPGTKNSVILHWFSGSRRELERGIELGFYFSVNHAMLQSKSGQAALGVLPRERVLTETDAPFARVAGKPSSPKEIKTAAEVLAVALKLSLAEAAALVQTNFLSILRVHGIID